MRVAVGQPRTRLGDKGYNIRSIAAMTKSLARRDADVVCFPELCTTGYALYENWPKHSEPVPGPTSDALGKVAKESGMFVVFGMPERAKGRATYDSAVMVDPRGEVAGVYRKVHLWDKERIYFTPGDGFPTFDTKLGRIGIGICYDIEFPESARALAMNGAQLLLFASAEPKWMRRHIDTYAASRAAENCVYLGYSNLSGKEPGLEYMGHSQILSPGCKVLAEVSRGFGAAMAEVNLRDLEKFRKELPYLEQRVPSAYADAGAPPQA